MTLLLLAGLPRRLWVRRYLQLKHLPSGSESFFRAGSHWWVDAKLFLPFCSKNHIFCCYRIEVVVIFVTGVGFFSRVKNYLFEIVIFFSLLSNKSIFRFFFCRCWSQRNLNLTANQNAVKKTPAKTKIIIYPSLV